jgi:hypothetical protein
LSGTLYCQYCESEIKLIRSTEQYKRLGCLNGAKKAHGCQLAASKSARVVEECLLGFLRDSLFNEQAIEKLVSKANEYLKQEAKKPLIDVAPRRSLHRSHCA